MKQANSKRTAVISLPMSPGKIVSNNVIKNVAVFTISSGCGGGSLWKEYITDFDAEKIKDAGLRQFTTVVGEQIWINTANIVKIDNNYKAAVTEFRFENMHFPNEKHQSHIYLVKNSDNVSCVNNYGYNYNPLHYKPELIHKEILAE